MNPELSIIIVSYNVYGFLKKCIESIYAVNIPYAIEIIIIDNHSNDESAIKIPLEFPQVIWIQNQENVGFAAANNQGIKISKGQYIWLLNPDTVVKQRAVEELIQTLQNDPMVGACGSKLLNPDGSLQISCYPFPTLAIEFIRLHHLESLFPKSHYPMDRWATANLHPVDNIQGASLMIRKTALNQIGLMDESFFVYTEEVDLNYRLKKAGWKNLWVPSSEVIHFGGQSTRQNQTEMFLELYKTKIHFFRKHFGYFKMNIYKFILFETAVVRVVAGRFLNLFKPNRNRQSLLINYQQLLKNLSDY